MTSPWTSPARESGLPWWRRFPGSAAWRPCAWGRRRCAGTAGPAAPWTAAGAQRPRSPRTAWVPAGRSARRAGMTSPGDPHPSAPAGPGRNPQPPLFGWSAAWTVPSPRTCRGPGEGRVLVWTAGPRRQEPGSARKPSWFASPTLWRGSTPGPLLFRLAQRWRRVGTASSLSLLPAERFQRHSKRRRFQCHCRHPMLQSWRRRRPDPRSETETLLMCRKRTQPSASCRIGLGGRPSRRRRRRRPHQHQRILRRQTGRGTGHSVRPYLRPRRQRVLWVEAEAAVTARWKARPAAAAEAVPEALLPLSRPHSRPSRDFSSRGSITLRMTLEGIRVTKLRPSTCWLFIAGEGSRLRLAGSYPRRDTTGFQCSGLPPAPRLSFVWNVGLGGLPSGASSLSAFWGVIPALLRGLTFLRTSMCDLEETSCRGRFLWGTMRIRPGLGPPPIPPPSLLFFCFWKTVRGSG